MVSIPIVNGLSKDIQNEIESANQRETELRNSFAELQVQKNKIIERYLAPSVADEIESLRHSSSELQREELEVAKLKLEVASKAYEHLAENSPKRPEDCLTQDELIRAKRETVRLQNLLNSGQSDDLNKDQKQLASLVKQTSIHAKNAEEIRQHRVNCQAMSECRSALQSEVEEIDNALKQRVRAMVAMA